MPIASSLLKKPRLVKKLKDFYTHVKKMTVRSVQKQEALTLTSIMLAILDVNIVLQILQKEIMLKNI